MSDLAILGGYPVRNISQNPWPSWPKWDETEEQALIEVLRSGVWSYNGPMEKAFTTAWANFVGSKYALCAVNGTVTLQLALEACGIGLGDEVIVPGLTWQATAASVLDVNAAPVIVDVRSDNWCLDVEAAEAAITPRTRAIIPVHLYGSFADMDAVLDLAARHDLFVIEDAAHKHGGEWRGKKAGSIGDIGSFSFQLSKLMTAGEGGALTTSNTELYEKLDALRNCGRRPEIGELEDRGSGKYGDEGNFLQSGNYRITEFQAAVLLQQLKRLPGQISHSDGNARHLNTLLEELPGVTTIYQDPRETLSAFYNFAFRYDKSAFKDVPVEKFRSALAAELGCSVDACYEPLNDCPLYAPHTKPSRYRLNEEYWKAIDPSQLDLPACTRAYKEESVCFHLAVLMGDRSDTEMIAAAVEKIYGEADRL